jgi:hypothetical protein
VLGEKLKIAQGFVELEVHLGGESKLVVIVMLD